VVELETDKVTLEVNAPTAGTLAEVLVNEGDTVGVGALLGRIGEAAASADSGAQDSGAQDSGAKAKSAGEAPAAGGDGGGESVELTVPSLGESVNEATLAQWLKNVGDSVAADEPVAELETDKVTLEVNAPTAGVLAEQLVAADATVQAGGVIGRITAGGAPAARPAADPDPAPKAAPAEATEVAAPARGDGGLDPDRAPRSGDRITRRDLEQFLAGGPDSMNPEDLPPAVRHLVHEHNLDPTRIPASGPGGRLTKEDIIAVVEGRTKLIELPAGGAAASQSVPASAPAGGGAAPAQPQPAASGQREERVKISRLRQTIARRLKEAQNTAAMLTTFNEVDMTAVNAVRARYKEDFEKAHGIRLGMSCFFAKAVVQALKELPAVNARIDGDEIVYNHYYDIGMAVSTPQGLMVPVVRDVDRKSMAEIEGTLRDLAKRGRDGKLKMDEMQGATFSITNGGVFGSLLSTPILNMPQSGILGMHKIQDRPMAVDGKVEIRPMMYLALSYDHRIIDGREAVTFLVRVKECLEDPTRLLLQM